MRAVLSRARVAISYCALLGFAWEARRAHLPSLVQEAATGQWFKFSDAHVEKLQGRNTKLGSEVDPMLNGNSNHHNGSNGHQHLANGFGGAKRMVNGSAKFIKV